MKGLRRFVEDVEVERQQRRYSKSLLLGLCKSRCVPFPTTALLPSPRSSESNRKKDVWAAFNLGQTTLIPTGSWVHDESVESVAAKGDLDDYCNLTLLSFARALNLLNEGNVASRSRGHSFGESARRLWAGLQLWRRLRPPRARELLRREGGRGAPFPTLVYTHSSASKCGIQRERFGVGAYCVAVCGNTFYHAACILLFQTREIEDDPELDDMVMVSPSRVFVMLLAVD